MKKGYRVGISILIIFLTVGYFYYTFPRKVNLAYDGIKCNINDQQQQEQVKINLTGFYHNQIFAKDFFRGSVTIDNEIYPDLKLLIEDQLQMIQYRDYEGSGKLHTYGEAFIEENLKALTILLVHDTENGWEGEDGLILSAPAKNKAEALEIYNKLMKKILGNF